MSFRWNIVKGGVCMGNKKIPEFLTEQEQKQLINVFNVRYFSSYRNKVMIILFLNTGLRLAEMIDCQWRDINLMTGQLKVVEGKGKKDRIIWIDEDTVTMLEQWKERQFNELGRQEYVFTNRNGKQLVARDIREMIVNYSTKAGIEKHVTPHTLRHSFASDLLRATDNIRKVQKALGHSSISTTQVYTHIVDSELEQAMKGFRKKLKK
jgi:Site-specific recombinase XerD